MGKTSIGARRWIFTLTLVGLSVASACPGWAQDNTELAKKVQNPVADLISVPFQNDFNFGVGSHDNLQYILNLQPVVPFHLSPDWNLITRTIVPLIYQPLLAPGIGDEFGLGDSQISLFLSPARPGALIWGVGPVLQFPTSTAHVLGTEQWAAGPTAVVLNMSGPWVFGALANDLWSVAGNAGRESLNQTLVQPFVNYNFKEGWYLSSSPIITANWKATNSDTWTVPVGGGVGKIVHLGRLPLNLQLQSFYNVERPSGAADWQLRFQFQFLLPR